MSDSKKDNKIAKAFATGFESVVAASDLSGQVANEMAQQQMMQSSYSQESVIENEKTSISQEEMLQKITERVAGEIESTQNTSIEDKTKGQNIEPKRPKPKEESTNNEVKTEPKRPTPKEESTNNEVKTESKRPTPKETIETKEKEEEKKQSYNQSTYSQGYGY